ncbi:threonine-phosphate decarboxylase CobD [Desulforamulus hydrothermalis]|uniref:threonine-phosphate decarboxylase n=1 Tax=Desulforamulus hydrothermalis Lam5 = DSM 18033 TaxID=1121428 RepID=K8DYT4_9FIRM|nr:threonine-phosphate decarboxylase CobD [Desulforamulus hydrothermalis]CCO07970.1 L-threonine-O-3-phosphate decarboxylase [Desulforamulus hydrothermalis Lam5 = DSM 18033]SHG85110.1 L-threonine O-3-phosphate decarboxylase [Desulforamulus hydrothermalis Lam5 = DSM 18033]
MQHGGNVWRAAQAYGVPKERILDFSANINPLGPSPKAMAALQAALADIKHYPEPQAETLRRLIANITGVPESMLILGNGAAELIYALAGVIKPRRVVLPVPAFSEYAAAFAAFAQLEVVLPPEQNFCLDVGQLLRLLQPGDLLILANPNNPTGGLIEPTELAQLVWGTGRAGAWLLVDEAFMDFVRPSRTLLPEVSGHPWLMILRSLTKFFAMPGLRLGYLAAAPYIIKQLTDCLPPWRVNLPAQAAGLASLQDTDYIETTLKLIHRQRDWLAAGLAALPGLRPLPAAANYILVDCRAGGLTAGQIQAHLGPAGILIRNCDNFRGLDSYYFRVAVRSQEENRILLHHLQTIITG